MPDFEFCFVCLSFSKSTTIPFTLIFTSPNTPELKMLTPTLSKGIRENKTNFENFRNFISRDSLSQERHIRICSKALVSIFIYSKSKNPRNYFFDVTFNNSDPDSLEINKMYASFFYEFETRFVYL